MPEPYELYNAFVEELTFQKKNWVYRANCRDVHPSEMYPAGNASQLRVAKRICAACPVRLQCLDFALVAKEDFGVWGGSTESQRRTILRSVQRRHHYMRMYWTPEGRQAILAAARKFIGIPENLDKKTDGEDEILLHVYE